MKPRVRRFDAASRYLCPLLAAGSLILATPGSAEESPQTRLEKVEKALGDSRARQAAAAAREAALAAELNSLRADAVTAALATQQHEAALSELDTRLAALASENRAKEIALARAGARQAQLLLTLADLAQSPPEGLLLAPVDPVDALRGALLMGRAVPALEARAGNLKTELAALAAVRAEIDATKARQGEARDALRADQEHIAALIERKARLQQTAARSAAEGRQRLQTLAAEAGTLRDLIDRLQGGETPPSRAVATTPPRPEFAKPARIRPFAAAKGAMVVPVAGTLLRRYGAPDEVGAASRGLTFLTRPAAQVVAPFDGRVLFAGPFRGYGQILIIGHGDGYHSLLAGLEHVDSSVGQWLVAGEPVGTMADRADKPHLYLELRHNNQPVNPLPWLPTLVEKVNG